MDYIAQPKDYWIAQGAITITLNALGNPNRMQGSVASGAAILCYIEGVDGLGYDNGHRFKTWPLSLSPTYFNSNTQKYVYAAIPRTATVGTQAVVVFPSEKLDVYGKNSDGAQVGSSDYYYIWLQGIISSSGEYGTTNRTWTEEMDFGKKGTDEDLYDDTDGEWYQYSKVSEIVTFLKNITMKAGTTFYNLYLGYKELTGVATAATGEEYVDSETLVVTPSYLQGKYLSRQKEDVAEEQIGFLKGIWIGIKDLYEITAEGIAKFKSLFVEDITAQRMQVEDMQSSNYTGDGIADTGWRLTKDYNGHSKLTIDELYVRMKAVFESLEVKKEMVTGGNQIFSRAANVICRTDYYNSDDEVIGYSEVKVPWLLRGLSMVLSKRILSGIYAKVKPLRISISDPTEIAYIRCYFLAEEGGRKVNNLWSVTGGHDLARCQTFNLNRSERKTYVDGEDVKLGNVFWWRKVIAVSSNSSPVEIDGKKYHYFDVSNQSGGYMDGSDLPCAGDEVSQWGNDANEARMHLVTIEVDGGVAIKAYEGIYTFDMSKCWYGGNPCKMNLSPQNEYRFTGRSFKIETEYGVRPVPVDIDVDWASQTKSRAEYPETGIAVGDLIVKNYYYDRVPHNGSLWLCLFTGVAYWARYAKYDGGVITYVTEDVFNTLTDSQKLYVKVNSRTGLADNQVCRRQEYATAQPGTNSSVWKQEVAKGQNGIDAQDVEWTYIRTKTYIVPIIQNDRIYEDSNGRDYTEDEHLPQVMGNANIENNEGTYECTDDPKGVDDTWKYEWEIKRSKGAASDGHRTWNYYQGSMTLHANFAESAFIIDTDNDNDQFGTDSDSKVLVQQVRKTTVALYDGADPQTLTALTATLVYEDNTSVPSTVAEVSTTPATGVVEVTVLQNSTANTHSEIRANITATCSKGSKQTTFTLRKVMGGAPGLNPIIYQLAPVQKTFSFARGTSNILTPSSRSTQINVSKTEGNTTTILSTAQTGITFQWGFDVSATAEETGKAVGSSIEVTKANAGSHYQVWVELSTGDRETLPIIKDGATGAMGDTPMQAFQWNQSATTAPSPLPSGATLGNWSLTAPTRPTSAGKHYLWMTETVKHTSASGTVTYDTWSAATRVSGDDGAVGENAVSIVISPASLIVNQDLQSPDNLSDLTQTFVVRVYKGDVEQTVGGLSFVAESVPNSSPVKYKCLFLNGGGQRSGNSSIAGNELTLKEIRTYTQGGKTLYYDSMFVDVTATYNTNKTIKARVRIYANLLGAWKETVEADVKHEVATGKFYFEDSEGNVVAHETIGDYIKSSTQNISRLAKMIDDGKNLLTVTKGWEGPNGAAVQYDNKYFGVKSSDALYSPVRLGVEGEQYCFSAYIPVGSQISGNPGFCYGTSYDHASDLDDNGTYQSATFIEIPGDTITIGSTTYQRYYFHIPGSIVKDRYFTIYNDGGYWLYYPQLELGTEPTAFASSSVEISSQIKQTADAIALAVQQGYATKSELQITADGITAEVNAIKAGKNLLTGALTGTNFGSSTTKNFINNPSLKAVTVDSDGYLIAAENYTYIFHAGITIERGKWYTVSFETKTNQTSVGFCVFNYSGDGSVFSGDGCDTNCLPTTSGKKKTAKFKVSGTGTVTIAISIKCAAIRYPQLELGEEATAFVSGDTEVSSRIKQTADNIELNVKNGLNEVGISILGNTNKVVAKAGTFEVHNSSGVKTFGIDNDGNLQGSGNAAFKGTVYADSGYFNGSLRTTFHDISNESGWKYYSSSDTRPSGMGVGWNYLVGDYDNMCMLAKKTTPSGGTANNLHVRLPNMLSMIGRRIILYEMNQPPFSDGASFFEIRQMNGAAFVGVSAGGHGIIDFQAVYGVEICGGVVEFLAVPHPTNATICTWAIINIGGCIWDYE